MATKVEVHAKIFERINDPRQQIFYSVRKGTLEKDKYLAEIKTECLQSGLLEADAQEIVAEVERQLWGFGPIDDLIKDDSISDIRLVDADHIRVKRRGVRESVPSRFTSQQEYATFIDNILAMNNTSMSIANAGQVFTDDSTSEKDILRFTLASSFINTNKSPTLLIRKIPKEKKTFEKLISEGYCTAAQAEFIRKRWQEGHGILVCGPNGSGKTTLVNATLDTTPFDKSAVILQESEELFSTGHPEMIFRKVIPPRRGVDISYTLKDLAKIALMESFDIFVIGEIKGDEAADLSYATYTGSQAMTTVHSNSAKEGYEKIIDYALAAQPNRSREHFAKQIQTIDTTIYVKDYKVEEISVIDHYDPELGEYVFREVSLNE